MNALPSLGGGVGVGMAMGIYLEMVQRSFISVVTYLPSQGGC